MVTIKSQRALSILQASRSFCTDQASGMRHFPGDFLNLWVELELDQQIVKKMSFFGEMEDWKKVILESMASLMIGKDLAKLDQLSLRECEAFLRDRNSELALENLPESSENDFKKFFNWMRLWPVNNSGEVYVFTSEKGPFKNLKLADKVRALKSFLNSSEVVELYQGLVRPELTDVDGLTVYIEAPYQTEKERAAFEELHLRGVAAFQEEKLNFIPEA